MTLPKYSMKELVTECCIIRGKGGIKDCYKNIKANKKHDKKRTKIKA